MHCPVCKASNDPGETCRRCKADLSLLWAVEQQRQVEISRARRWLTQGRWEEAIAAADQAGQLRSDAEVHRLRAMAHVLRRDFASAWAEVRRQAHQ